MARLFSSFNVGKNLVSKNRICLSPMSMYSAEDGFVNDFHLVHLGARALGGAGIVMLEAASVSEHGRISRGDVGIYRDEHVSQLKRITDFLHKQNALAGIELFHGGRKGSTNVMWVDRGRPLSEEEDAWETLAPSAIAYGDMPTPKEATLDDIESVKNSYKDAARRAHEAGFDVINLHVGYGYLLNTFISPYSNKRSDQYGGSLENRTRIVMEILADMRSVLPQDYPIMVRLSVADSLPDCEGWTLDDTIAFVKMLQAEGVSLMDLVYGANVEPNNAVAELTVTPFAAAAAIRKECDITIGINGGIVSPKWADQIISTGMADFVVLGKAILDNPQWPIVASIELEQESPQPPQYGWVLGPKGSWQTQLKPAQNSAEMEMFKD